MIFSEISRSAGTPTSFSTNCYKHIAPLELKSEKLHKFLVKKRCVDTNGSHPGRRSGVLLPVITGSNLKPASGKLVKKTID
jgi:hypothetical protein